MRYLIVEGITDVAFIKYVCLKNNISLNFNDFKLQKSDGEIDIYRNEQLFIMNLKGQSNLEDGLGILKPMIRKIDKIAILQDADGDYDKSLIEVEDAIQELSLENIEIFLTPNDKDEGDLETLLLSTLNKKEISQLECFKDYKSCLSQKIDTSKKAMDKAELYAYTMFAVDGKNNYTPQNSFIYKKNKNYIDTNLWDLSKDEFQPIIKFILKILGEK